MQLRSLLQVLLRSLWVIVLAIVVVVGIFYFYGKKTVRTFAVNTITIVPSNTIPASTAYSGNEVFLSAGYFGGLIRTWFVSPDFVKDTYAAAGATASDEELSEPPFILQPGQSPLTYRIEKSTDATNQTNDIRIVDASVKVIDTRVASFNQQAEEKLRFEVNDSGTMLVTKDNTKNLLKLVAPLLGLFVGIFIVVVREAYRKR